MFLVTLACYFAITFACCVCLLFLFVVSACSACSLCLLVVPVRCVCLLYLFVVSVMLLLFGLLPSACCHFLLSFTCCHLLAAICLLLATSNCYLLLAAPDCCLLLLATSVGYHRPVPAAHVLGMSSEDAASPWCRLPGVRHSSIRKTLRSAA